ncbi:MULTISPECIES: MotA/TolQ/ExbB proton channel family protein [Croceibacter]|jgi:biopolymer transport protein ExbB|uniref:Putative biopolymer transport protein n=1 Tax=Croceibacter atlanticus (strain ATCC BAA-628 / JCM 21780 / CIP 108009 / IAM 15332 / KCTC 12090 / HTCC2559) TaxID=216432 RepID=A3U850_CROAH|nr:MULTISPECIES: MotA/TolQ/ExbB proton channel family protein [Croceibacter]HAT69992.1 MotA/TolQ/ExbB proton channel family protein [Flavobacteriaceae bacterium]EAP88417.1 putative biopolymer transport protein [Croceibacter atlanticus HTCC2559]MAM22820.1 MotA/TolQ/ExbB proton channel family protein [Croceibacter sp.]MBG26729.1 MotA/TolQ/ExbB proton channel family protein [Croceibacter sp.]MBW4969449.1 MotA/TolQ/ExbB proton channel family protein [Croceibacter atlanticus]|tara:strand:- start:2 stop:688 length:687 start_codon:yes stop_codon:yes gene_type:complete
MSYTFQDAAQDLEPVAEEKTLSLLDLLFSGGMAGSIIIGVLFVLLFAAVYIYFERLFAIKAASKTDKNFMHQIRDNVAGGNIEAAKIRCAQENSPVARLTAKGISRIGSPLEDINTAIENAGRLEVYKLEKNVSVLATIAGAAPMIGFLGTVIGMVLAFHQLATSSGQAEMGNLAEGIYTAMTTTVAGLIVGIIAYIGYNHLVVKTDKVVHQMEATAVDFLDLLNEPA